MTRQRAPWSSLLIGTSAVATVLCVLLALVGYGRLPHVPAWFPLLLLLAPLLALPFIITGYSLRDGMLLIHRPGWDYKAPLADFVSAEFTPHSMSGNIRLFGNGGFYSFTGLYTNPRLGRYRAFWTDQRRTVVLVFRKRKIVISPEHPEAFVAEIQSAANPFAPTTK
ncbi:MAG: PH domain-containing protein [Chthoniobacterales bacterium]